MKAYYNEFKPEAAHMLRQLINDGLIAPGDVDERSITEVKSDDLKGYTQCHFFAGIGGWSVALRMAGWDDSRPVWTGSCPCQPFSTAGKQKGKADERHLWPVWFRLIQECKPPVVFGEQVASAVAHGWWDDVADDLEREGYACGAAVLPACSVGKPHKRDRLWFVGNAEHNGWYGGQVAGSNGAAVRDNAQGQNCTSQFTRASESIDVADAPRHEEQPATARGLYAEPSAESYGSARSNVADTNSARLQGHRRHEQQHGEAGRQNQDGHAGPTYFRWLSCPDGKQRPIESGICLLAHGVQHRAPILHAFGNAIVPRLAAEFIKATE